MIYKKLKAIIFVWKEMRKENKPFILKKRIKEIVKWHVPFDFGHNCPSCGSFNFKNNGSGFYRCKECNKRFYILITNNEEQERDTH